MAKSRLVFMIMIGVIGGLIFIPFFGKINAVINPFEVELSIDIFEPGYTKIMLPPLGEIKARTHLSPLGFKIMLKNINLESAIAEINNFNEKDFVVKLQDQFKQAIKMLVYRLLFLSFIGGGILGYIFKYNKRNEILICGLAGLLVVFSFMIFCYKTYDYNSFTSAEYSGTLNNTTWLVNLAKESMDKIEELESQMENMAKNIYLITEKMNDKEVFGIDEEFTKILHVSDIHNNVTSIDFIEQIVEDFDIDFIIDTGDITDYGTALEGSLLNRIEKLQCPYVFVAGNHDSPTIVEKLKSLNNVLVLENEFVTLENINILGIPDPASKINDIKPVGGYQIERSVEEINELIEKNETQIHVLATHNPNIAKAFNGKIPTILFGHTHTFGIEETAKSVMINAGTTGGAGIRGLQSSKEIPYSMAIVYFDRNDLNYPKVIDIIKLYNIRKGFVLERTWTKNH